MWCFISFFLLDIKMSENTNLTYYQKTRDVILNRAKDYYDYDLGGFRGQARDKYRNLSEEEKNKKREHGKNRYHNISEKNRYHNMSEKKKTKRISKKLS